MNNNKKFNNTSSRPKILVSPLNWGLGHSTRCIPVIIFLQSLNCEVVIAADGASLHLLQKQFPENIFLTPPAYDIQYSKRSFLLKWKLLWQLPKLLQAIKKENNWLDKIIEEYDIDAVISDNRFGLHSKKIPCIYITHQLLIKTGFSFSEKILQNIHYKCIRNFVQCWIPDAEHEGLAGELSHPGILPDKAKFIGPVSRFFQKETTVKYSILIVLSGPEPQRTLLEENILTALKNIKQDVILVRGLPQAEKDLTLNNNFVSIKNYADANELNELILQSEIIISRCGYTTVMDLVKLQKKAVLIPTPGQTEQEYLAQYLMQQQIFYCVKQKDFILLNSIKKATDFSNHFPQINYEAYKTAIAEFVLSLPTKISSQEQ